MGPYQTIGGGGAIIQHFVIQYMDTGRVHAFTDTRTEYTIGNLCMCVRERIEGNSTLD